MATFWNSYQPESEQLMEQEVLSDVEAFMVSRVAELQDYGWSNENIAEALGVDDKFVEDHSSH